MIEALAYYYDMICKIIETMETGYYRAVWEDRLERIKRIQAKLEESIGYSRVKQLEICKIRKRDRYDDIGEDAFVIASRR